MARKYYRKKKALSKKNIFGKKSAKSQAKQIYALNRKVNYIQKTTSPETKTYSQVLFYFDSYDSYHSALLPEWHHRYDLYSERVLNSNLKKYLSLDGDLLRVKNIYIYGYVGLKDWTFLTSTSPQQELNIPKDAYFKLTVCRVIKGGSNYPSQVYDQLINLSNNSNPGLDEGIPISAINGPLSEGISSQLQVLKKKVIHITPAKPSKMMKIKLFNSKKVNLNYRKTITGAYSQGEIMIFIDYISPVSLYRTSDNPPTMIAPRIVAQFNYKIVYSDDGTKIIENNA